ncbi:TolC family outer membrane protein [Photobacterium leiognathi]|uniref:TolC family outer membrane protein n=1 Tax=Photobacterium leiognathi TaxID=553611 RepID=UPI00273737D8|nr:TolC family outer membrane protein [Photobacterium leiognathi]
MNTPIAQSLRKTITAMAVVSVLVPVTTNAQTLEQAVATTITTNPTIRQAYSRFKVREEQVVQAKAGYLPSLDLTAGYGWEQTDTPSSRAKALATNGDEKTDLNRRELGLSLRQTLFDGFLTSSEVHRTSHEASSDQWNLFAAAEDTGLEAIKVYLHFMEADQEVQLAEKNLARHQHIYGQIKQKTAIGLGSTADLSQSRGRLARAQSNLIAAKNNFFDARSQFIKVVNQAPEDLHQPVPDASMLPTSLDAAIAQAKANHPTLKVAENDIKAAKYQRESAKSSYYPRVRLDLGGNWDENVGGVEGHNNDLQAMVRMNYNLFSGGKDVSRDREAAYKLVEAQELEQRSMRDVVDGTTLAWNAYQFINEQKGYIHDHVIAAKETQSSYAQQFKLGQRSLLDVLDSENELFQARKDYLKAEYDELIAQYRVLNATGELLSSLRVTKPTAWYGETMYEGGVKKA